MSKIRLFRCVAALLMLLSASVASAAGLGKLTVISALGQPFRGEIDLVAVTKEEQSLLNVRLASPDAFRQADIPLTAFVSNLKLAIETRPGGEQFIKVSSAQPLSEPFIDFLVELYWSSGRLVRAYTALVDPPSTAETPGGAVEIKPLPPAQGVEGPGTPAFIEPQPAGSRPAGSEDGQLRGVDVEPSLAQAPPRQGGTVVPEPGMQTGGAPAAPAGYAGEHTVKRGDTLAKIAAANKPAEVSLDQMLVSLFRANPEAFAGKNMNRLKVGQVLRIPDATVADDVAAAEARREVRAQAANWNAYREKLAAIAGGGPAAASAPAQSAGGKVSSVTEDKAAALPDAPKEVLKLSKGEGEKSGAAMAGKGASERVRSLEEEVAAKSKALGEANQRVAALEKTVKDMELLMEIKSKGLSEAQKAAEATKPASQPPNVLEPGKPESPKSQEPAVAAPKEQAPDATTAEPPKAPEAAVPPPAAEAPKPKPKPKLPPPPPPPPPGFLDQLLDDPLILAGAAAALLGAGGLGFVAYKRRKGGGGAVKEEKVKAKGGKKNSSVERTPEEKAPIGVAAAAAAAPSTPEEGDALDEVDVLLTYGRYDLAEQRLQEAIAANPTRYELHGKLLEIYAHRNNAAAFDQLAREVQIGTGGKGEVWEKAVRLGFQIDPDNPRYAAGRGAASVGTTTVTMGAGALAATAGREAAEALAATDLDFNLDLDAGAQGTSADIDLTDLEGGNGEASVTPTDIDITSFGNTAPESEQFDPGAQLPDLASQDTVVVQAQQPQTASLDTSAGLDFNIDIPELSLPPPAASEALPADDGAGLDFDIGSLDLGAGPGVAEPTPDIDLSGIDLALGGAVAPQGGDGHDEHWYDVQTKFDLAKAYQEMGDKEGAREVLQEVIAEGDAQQKQAAEQVLASLG